MRYTDLTNTEKKRLARERHPWIVNHDGAIARCRRRKEYINKNIKYEMTREEVKKLWFRDKAYQMFCPTIHRKNNNGNYVFNNCEFLEKSIHNSIPKNFNFNPIYYEQF